MSNILNLSISMKTLDFHDHNAQITRISITPFYLSEKLSFQELMERTLYLSIEQTDDTIKDDMILQWWNKQPQDIQEESFLPKTTDLSLEDASWKINEFLQKWNYNKFESLIWSRNYGLYWNILFGSMSTNLGKFNWHECKTINMIGTGMETDKLPLNIEVQTQNAQHESVCEALRLLSFMGE